MPRLPAAPGQIIDRTRTLSFQIDGRPATGFAGDTIASALRAAGQVIFSRSFKYHRPRGLLCVSGKCPNCLMNVDGVPNVRTCTEPLREGVRVQAQNCWPSLENDRLSIIEKFDYLLPVGFYYKMFARPQWAWKKVEPIIRKLAGLGQIADDAPDTHFDHLHLRCDIAVVGGGPAGMSAALSSAESGAEVFLIDDEPQLGGHLRRHRFLFGAGNEPGFEIARRLATQVAERQNIRVFNRAVAFAAYEGGLLALRHENTLVHLRASKLVVATGSFEYPPSFDGNDLPGVMLASGVRNLVHLYGVKPGAEAVLCGCDDDALALALELQECGIVVRAVADIRNSQPAGPWADALQRASVPVLAGYRVIRASGSGKVEKVDLARSGESSTRSFVCDLLVLGTQYSGSLELLRQSGVRCEYDDQLHQMRPQGTLPDVFSAGRLNGIRRLDLEILGGELAGLEAASEIPGSGSQLQSRSSQLREKLREGEAEFRSSLRDQRPVLLPDSSSQFVCFCEDVKQKDISQAIEEGFYELETLKRYSTTSMGPCQGRMCLMSASALCAERTGRTLRETGATTARPPVQPVPLGLLAGAHHNPMKLTPMHYKHVETGAKQTDMGEWKRPHTYSSQQEEWRAVRERVGIIDLSTLGKLDVQGKQAGILLDKVYTHSISTLKQGRIRYGVVCNDEGILLDDGTVSRISDSRYFITTTTGNVEFMERWLGSWQAGTGLCAHVTNVTGDYAAVNIAGPKARDTLRKLTDANLDSAAFPYMACKQASVAGIPATLLRIGFVGETGWEIHYPACFGEYLWDAILEAGSEFGIQPFGVETQRILRLEKKHVIIGQDTDALSNPFEADLAWCIKFDKEDFVGKDSLAYLKQRPEQQKLVGFVADASSAIPEGSVVVEGSRPVGRVTSCRISPYQGHCIGLAWVPIGSAQAGQPIQIRSNGTNLAAKVVHEPFYDPEGKRLRE